MTAFLRSPATWVPLLLLLVLAVYWPGLHGGFVFDDYPNIVDNTVLHVTAHASWPQWLAAAFSSPSSDLQRPLAMLSFAANIAATGLDPYWMKLTNVLIHALNAALVFALVRTLLRACAPQRPTAEGSRTQMWQALWISAAWALNPINLMAVLFIVQRMESLCQTFVFAGLWLYLLGRERLRRDGRGWPWMLIGLIGGTGIGVLVKESAALLPVYALLIEWALLRFAARDQPRSRGLAVMYLALVGVPALVGVAWQLPKLMRPAAYAGRGFSMGERLLTEGRVVIDYLHWTLLPNLGTLSLYHDDYPLSRSWLQPPSTLLAMAALAFLGLVAIALRRRRPLMALGLAWFLAAQLLTATVFPLELVYEHRNYFASLGLCLALGDLLLRIPSSEPRRRLGWLIAACVLVFYAGLTSLRAREWHDPLRFASSEAAKHPASPRATYDLARDLVIMTRYDPASPLIAPARLALDRAMRAPGATILPEAAAIMLAAHTRTPVDPAWWDSLQRKLASNPSGPQQAAALASLVDCDLKSVCHLPVAQMQQTFRMALERRSTAELLNIHGNYALNRLHDPALALRLWQRAATQAPDVVTYQATLARMLIASGRPDLARAPIARIRQLGRLGQNDALADELERRARASRTPPAAVSSP